MELIVSSDVSLINLYYLNGRKRKIDFTFLFENHLSRQYIGIHKYYELFAKYQSFLTTYFLLLYDLIIFNYI